MVGLCPLKFGAISVPGSRPGIFSHAPSRDCQGKQCSWWNRNECAFMTLTHGISILAGHKEQVSGSGVVGDQWEVCSYCDNRNPVGSKFCAKCGKGF